MGTEYKYCMFCGRKVSKDARFCPYCSKELGALNDSTFNELDSNYNTSEPNSMMSESNYAGSSSVSESSYAGSAVYRANNIGSASGSSFMESDFKVMAISKLFLYNLCTLGIYQLYWYYKNTKMLKNGFNKDVSPILRTIGLFIPLVNWVMYFVFLDEFKDLLNERGLDSFSLWANFIFICILSSCGLGIFALLNIQEYINNLCIYEDSNLKINKDYTGGEIALISIALIIISITLIFAFLVGLVIISGY